MSREVTLVVLMTLTANLVLSQNNDALDSFVRDVQRCANIPYVSLALISQNDGSRYLQGYTTNRTVQVNQNSVFCIGGATRAFTAVLLANLLDRQVNTSFTWDTPIEQIVGHRLALPGTYLASHLTLRDVLVMRSGLAGMEIVPLARPFSAQKLVSNLKHAHRAAGFREKFIYNEVLFSLIEEVVQVLANNSWRNLIQQTILEPLGMRNTIFADTQSSSSAQVIEGSYLYNQQSVFLGKDAYRGLDLVAPAASLCTSAADMSIWLDFLLRYGKISNTPWISSTALEATFLPVQSRGQDDDPVTQGYQQPFLPFSYTRDLNSLGFINGYFQGNPFISQDGSHLAGYQSLATVIPSRKVAAYVAFSGDLDEKRFRAKVLLNSYALDILLNKSPARNFSSVCSLINNVYSSPDRRNNDRLAHVQRTVSKPARPLEDYEGRYFNYAYGSVIVERGNDTTSEGLELKYGVAVYTLYTTNKNDTFELLIRSRSLWFTTHGDSYRDKQQHLFAEFSYDPYDPDRKINSIKIYGFDKNHVPEFLTNPRPPVYPDDYYEDYRCGGTTLNTWQLLALVVIALVSVR